MGALLDIFHLYMRAETVAVIVNHIDTRGKKPDEETVDRLRMVQKEGLSVMPQD